MFLIGVTYKGTLKVTRADGVICINSRMNCANMFVIIIIIFMVNMLRVFFRNGSILLYKFVFYFFILIVCLACLSPARYNTQ